MKSGHETETVAFVTVAAGKARSSASDWFAPAKLTLSLRIVGVRDDGNHLIEAEMVTLDFGDRLEIRERHGNKTMRRQHEALMLDAAGRELRDLAPPGENLVERALAMAEQLTGRRADATVHKQIPAGAGLGGGSADAAAVLRWAGITDPLTAVTLGADVAFCLVGGRARVRGIGEIIEPLEYVCEHYTLQLSPLHCVTGAVYEAWDQMGGPAGEHGNDLESAALWVSPELAQWRDELGDSTGLTPRLAGSGSTWFVAGAHPGPGRVVAATTPAPSGGA